MGRIVELSPEPVYAKLHMATALPDSSIQPMSDVHMDMAVDQPWKQKLSSAVDSIDSKRLDVRGNFEDTPICNEQVRVIKDPLIVHRDNGRVFQDIGQAASSLLIYRFKMINRLK